MKIICPSRGQGSPIFVNCPSCDFLTVQCEELGNIFLDLKDLSKGFVDKCPI